MWYQFAQYGFKRDMDTIICDPNQVSHGTLITPPNTLWVPEWHEPANTIVIQDHTWVLVAIILGYFTLQAIAEMINAFKK